MSLEEFPPQEAWPGVQPSSFGGGEASAAQEPQAEQKDDDEAILEILESFIPEAEPKANPVTAEASSEATP